MVADLFARGGLLQRRHQRPDPVPAGGRPRRPAGVVAVPAAAPGRPADARGGSQGGAGERAAASPCAGRWPASRSGRAARRARHPRAVDGPVRRSRASKAALRAVSAAQARTLAERCVARERCARSRLRKPRGHGSGWARTALVSKILHVKKAECLCPPREGRDDPGAIGSALFETNPGRSSEMLDPMHRRRLPSGRTGAAAADRGSRAIFRRPS